MSEASIPFCNTGTDLSFFFFCSIFTFLAADKDISLFEQENSKYTLNSEPKALTGDKSEGIKSRGFYPRIFPSWSRGRRI